MALRQQRRKHCARLQGHGEAVDVWLRAAGLAQNAQNAQTAQTETGPVAEHCRVRCDPIHHDVMLSPHSVCICLRTASVPAFHICASLSNERTDLWIIARGTGKFATGDAGSAATGRELQRVGSSGLSAAPSGSAGSLLPGNSREFNDLRDYEDAGHTTPVASESAGAFSTRNQLTRASIAPDVSTLSLRESALSHPWTVAPVGPLRPTLCKNTLGTDLQVRPTNLRLCAGRDADGADGGGRQFRSRSMSAHSRNGGGSGGRGAADTDARTGWARGPDDQSSDGSGSSTGSGSESGGGSRRGGRQDEDRQASAKPKLDTVTPAGITAGCPVRSGLG